MENISDLQFTLENAGGLKRSMKVAVPAAPIETEIGKRLQQLAKTTRMNGFRPGKVPFKVVTNRFASGVRQEVVGETLQSTFYQAMAKQELLPAGLPKIEITCNEAGKDLEYQANFEVYPHIDLAGLGGLTLQKEVVEIADEDIDRMAETLRKQRTTWNPVERGAGDGDKVKLDLDATVDGEKFAGGSAKDVALIIGANSMPDGFEDQLKGLSSGDEKAITVTLPATYPEEKYASRPATFQVRVRQVEEPVLPELDEAFIKAFGVEDGSMAGFRQELRNNMQRELDSRLYRTMKNRVFDLLLENNRADLPEALVEAELHKMMHQGQGHQHAHDHDHRDATAEQRTTAEKRVALGLVLAEIVRQQSISPDAELVRKEVEKIAAPFEDKDMVINWYYDQEERLGDIRNMVLENQVVDWMIGQMKIEAKPAGFQDVMNPAPA